MKISDSSIDLFSQHKAEERGQQQQQLRLWRDGAGSRESTPPGDTPGIRSTDLRANTHQVSLEISQQSQASQPSKALVPEEAELSAVDGLEVSILKLLVERITGQKIALFDPRTLEANSTDQPAASLPSESAQTSQQEGWGLVYDAYASHYEGESMHFSAEGVVETRDGKRIEIQLELNLSREFFTEQRLSLRAGDALKDPLVINFDGNAAQLTRSKFRFDLDMDGRQEQISFVRPGSGFLALDKNQDGMVNDGGELFGPSGNDGFRELAGYDQDGNRWIDQNDAVYERLRIWSKDEAGKDRLIGLGQQGIGAIYLGHIDTPFKLTDSHNSALGQMNQTGLYIDEDGAVGTLQQIDLVV